MKIVVCIKQVPKVTDVRFDPERKTLIREGVTNIINPFDRRAITQAVRLRQQFGGDVTLVTMGPPQARQALLEGLAMGADRAIHICDPTLAGSDTLVTARILARAIEKLAPEADLVFCGKYSIDAETGQVGPEVAELLGWPHICGLTSLELDVEARRLTGERETDDGFERLEGSLPLVLTAAERLIRPIKVKPEDVEAIDAELIRQVTADQLGFSPDEVGLSGSPTMVTEIRSLEQSRRVEFLQGENLEAIARQLWDLLKQRGVLSGRHREPESQIAAKPVRVAGPEIWVTMERDGDRFRRVSGELLGEASRLADQLDGQACAVVFGSVTVEAIRRVGSWGADRIYTIEAPVLHPFIAEVWGQALAEVIAEKRPLAVFCPATSEGREYAPRAAARLGLGLTGDCIGLEVDSERRLIQLKPAFGGSIVASILTRTTPIMATIRPGVFPQPPTHADRQPPVERVPLDDLSKPAKRVLDRRLEGGELAEQLEQASIVIGVGAGLGGPEHLDLIRRLADRLGAAIGGSRKVVDLGWLPRQLQIGLTGKSIAPDLYLAVALRGNLNHSIGIRRARLVVAVNHDPQADIFQAADYGIVADYREFIPLLLQVAEESPEG